MTMVRSIKIQIIKPLDADWALLGQVLRDLDYVTWKAKNIAVTKFYVHNQTKLEYKKKHGVAMDEKKIFGKTYQNVIYAELNQTFKDFELSTNIIQGIVHSAKKAFSGAHGKSLMTGQSVLPTFKSGQPIPLPKVNIVQQDTSRVKIALLNKSGKAKHNRKTGQFEVDLNQKGNAKVILERLYSGEYQWADSSIIKGKNGKWFLNVAYKQPIQQVAVDKDTVLGVDLGIVNAFHMAVSSSRTTDFLRGGEIRAFKEKIQARRRDIQSQLKVASHNRRSRGRKTLLKPLESIKKKEANFTQTTNHRYAKRIVDYAIAHGCGTIQVEDLSGITKDEQRAKFLRHWTYFDLQEKIRYKAEAVGIEFRKIDPQYTSQRCNKCGIIDSKSRQSQSYFRCTACDYKANADANAARNIAILGIEEEIEAQCKAQGLPYRKKK